MGRTGPWAAAALAVPATLAFAVVRPEQPAPRWEPQLVALDHPAARYLVAPPPAAVVPKSGPGAVAVRAALTRLGDPYVWAAAGPHAFDCSGLVVWAFEQAGLSLPHSSQALAAGGQPVSLDQMQPGDVIAYYEGASHVGIYVGKGQIVHASTEGVPVAVAPMDEAPIYNVRRYR